MKDNGIVVSIKQDLADVEVQCLVVCHDCSAQSLCIGKKQKKGLLSVKNPIKACPGDEVTLEVPEENYNRALIQVFGTLLAASLLGLGLGVLFSDLLGFRTPESGLVGLLAGLFLGGTGLYFLFRNKNEKKLYPVITNIIKKGDCHG